MNSKEGESFDETLRRLSIYKQHGELYINHNHKYYYLIQQQQFCTGYKVCIWVHIDEVCFDASFWNMTLEKLETCYYQRIVPELVSPNIKFGCPRWGKVIPFPSQIVVKLPRHLCNYYK